MLLRFRVANHRSIRDEATFSMVSPALRGAAPTDGNWPAATLRAAGIYGANASGKSTLLDALSFLVSMTRHSATTWAEREQLPYSPFALDHIAQTEPSLYEIDFVVDEVRYTFGFRSLAAGVVEEWLFSYPARRRRLLYDRKGQEYEFGRALSGDNVRIGKATRPTTLFLSSAANSGHGFLRPVYREIVRHIRYARFQEDDRQARLHWIMRLIEDADALQTAVALLRFADFGISSIEIEEEPVSVEVRDAMRAMMASLSRARQGDVNNKLDLPPDFQRQFRFVHDAASGDMSRCGGATRFNLEQESSGTVAWLSLAVPALDALKHGDVFVVDEIDSSLHPTLTAELINLFKDSEVNRRAAQLIFTSHDTSLLGSLHGKLLDADEVWLTEKSPDGATELYSAAEFSVRARDNIERRYLQGRYGAIPTLARRELRQALMDEGERMAS